MRKELINAADKYQMNWIEGATVISRFLHLLRILVFTHLLMMIIVVLIFVQKCVATHIYIVEERCLM